MNVEPFASPQYSAAVQDLLVDLFGDSGGDRAGEPGCALAQPFGEWMSESRPFLAFAQTYRSKIRKKIRICRDTEEARNLNCELRTAYLLLQAPRLAVAYEPYTKESGRSADLAVTFRTRTRFHVEVTRLRASQQEQQLEGPAEDAVVLLRRIEGRRLADLVVDKVGQLAPDTPNVLWVWSESRVMHEVEIGQVMQELKRGVEQRDPALYTRYGFAKPGDFIRGYQRLSVILIQTLCEPVQDPAPARTALWWENHDARYALPGNVGALVRGVTGEG